MIKMKWSLLIYFIAVLLLSLPIASGALPDSIDDGNHFNQEITINSDSAQTDALIHFILPFPFGYSKAVQSYRFYDSSGNPIPFHVFNQTVDGSSVSMRINLSAGANIIYFTGGNLSLPSVQSTSVYDYYLPRVSNSSSSSLSISPPGQFNFAQIQTSPFGSYNSTTYVRFYGSYNCYARFNNTTGWWHWDSNSSTEISSLGRSETPENFIILNSSGPNTSVYVFTDRNNQSANAWLNYTNLTSSSDWVGTSIRVEGGGSAATVRNTTAAVGNYIPVTVRFGVPVMQPENINGLYVRFVSATTGNALSIKNMTNQFETPIPQVSLSGSLSTAPVYIKDLTLSFSSTSLKIVQNGTTRSYTPISNYFSGGTTVFVSNIDPLSTFYATTPGYGNLSSHNYTVNLKEQDGDYQRLITLPVTPGLVKGNGSRVYGVVMSSDYGPVPYANLDIRQTGGNSSQLTSLAGGMWGSWFASNSEFVGIASVSGYSDKSFYFYTQNNSTQVFDIYMEKLYNISISVVDENGTAVNSFTSFLGGNQSIRSTDDGTVHYNNVTGGEQELIIQASGYAQVTKMIYVNENSTDFVLTVTKEPAQEYITPHYVRLFYRTITGAPVADLNVTVYDSSGNSELFQAVTGTDGSVSFQLNETIQYRFVAMSGDTLINDFIVFPKSTEYVIFVSGTVVQPPSDVLSGIFYSITEEVPQQSLLQMRAAADTAMINVSMRSNSSPAVVDYKIIIYRGNILFDTRNGNFTDLKTETFTLPRGYIYTISITYTDEDGKSRTVSKTMRLDGSSAADKVKFSIPGFTEEWHYSALCVFIVLVTAFSFSVKTRRIGGLIIPGEMLIMGYIGWINVTAFAICLSIAVVIMSLIYFVEKAGSDESLS